MAAHEEYKLISKQLAKVLRDLLETGDWNTTLFLRTAHKKLHELHEEVAALTEQLDQVGSASQNFHDSKVKQGYIKIYVSLYQSDPYNLIKWQITLKSIKEYSINRPIYRSQEHIEEMLRSKQGSPNEGYVVIYIKPTDIIPPYAGKLIEDRWGHELLTLRDNSLAPDNIIEFIHQGRRYSFNDGKLTLKSDNK